MKKLLCLFLVFACVLSMGTFSAFAQNVSASADAPTIQPRANVVDVLSYQEVLIDRNGNSTVVSESYRRLSYVNGYGLDFKERTEITNDNDRKNGAKRYSFTFVYRTW